MTYTLVLRMIAFLAQLILLITRFKTELEDSCTDKSFQPPAGESEIDDGLWLEFDDLRRRIWWNGGEIVFGKRKVRRYKFVKLLWESFSEFVGVDEIAAEIGDHANPKWHAFRMLGNRTETQDLHRSNCPFAILQDGEGFVMFPRSG